LTEGIALTGFAERANPDMDCRRENGPARQVMANDIWFD
jgi:hypothetical protein